LELRREWLTIKEAAMSKKELIVRELDRVPEQDLEELLVYLRALRDDQVTAYAAESSLGKDWLSQEEDEAWAGL
jgi:hypothetical protein